MNSVTRVHFFCTELIHAKNETVHKDYKYNTNNNKQISLEILSNLNKIKTSENVEFVYGKGERKSKLQRFIEYFDELSTRQEKYEI